MSGESKHAEPKDPRIEAALGEYFERVSRGERLDRDAFIALHPEIAEALRSAIPVDKEELEAIKTILRSGLATQPWPFLSVGSRVYIEHGPLAGMDGIITNTDKAFRLVVSVSLLQRSIAVEIDREWARPIARGVCELARTWV